MAARAKSPRQQQIEQLLRAPINWLEERSRLVSATKWFLFRNVPRDVSWAQTLGSATLTAFLVLIATGVIDDVANLRRHAGAVPTLRPARDSADNDED